MKKLNFGAGNDTVLLSLGERKLFSYEIDRSALHARYGGQQFYQSRSGLSGAGSLDSEFDLIELGTYRVDVPHVGNHVKFTKPLLTPRGPAMVVVPISNHGGIQEKYPTVVIYEDQMILVWTDGRRLSSLLRSGPSREGVKKEVKISFLTKDGLETVSLKTNKPNRFQRFGWLEKPILLAFLRETIAEKTNQVPVSRDWKGDLMYKSPFHDLFKIVEVSDMGGFAHVRRCDSLEYMDQFFETDPLLQDEFFQAGWKWDLSRQQAWRRKGGDILVASLEGDTFEMSKADIWSVSWENGWPVLPKEEKEILKERVLEEGEWVEPILRR